MSNCALVVIASTWTNHSSALRAAITTAPAVLDAYDAAASKQRNRSAGRHGRRRCAVCDTLHYMRRAIVTRLRGIADWIEGTLPDRPVWFCVRCHPGHNMLACRQCTVRDAIADNIGNLVTKVWCCRCNTMHERNYGE